MEEIILKSKSKKSQGLPAFLWLVLPLSLLVLFCVYPAVSAIVKSFMDWSPNGNNKWIWFDNYKVIFTDLIFLKACKNMVILVFFTLLTSNIATLLLAEFLFNMAFKKTAKVLRYLFLIPALVPGMVTVLLWKNVILSGTEEGLMNILLGYLHIEPNAWYFSEKFSKFSIIMTNFPWVGGISFLIYLSGLQSIPESCIEAAKLDGVKTSQRVWYIDMPLLVSQLKYFFIVGIVNGVQNFDYQLIITDGGPNFSTTVPGYILYMNTYGYSALGEASAIGVILFLIAFVLTLTANKISSKAQEGNF